MEQFMSLVAVGFSQEFVINSLHRGILMALAEFFAFVLTVESRSTQGLVIHFHPLLGGNDGLAAAVHTAAGASHHFDKVIGLFAAADAVQQFGGVGGAVGNSHVHSQITDLHGSFLDAFQTTDLSEFDLFEGLAVQGLASLFMQMWNADAAQDGGELLDYALLESMNTPVNAPGWMIPYGDSPLDSERVGENVYIGFLNNAKNYVHIYTPYLVLGDQMLQALEYTARRGVEVKLILPHIPDKPYAFYLAHSYYGELLRSGVRIFEYTPGFVHSKEFISDGTIATIGTINLDFRSLYQHFENGVYMRDVPAIGQMEKDFQETLEKCEEFTMKDLEEYPKWKMAFGKVVRIFAPMF